MDVSHLHGGDLAHVQQMLEGATEGQREGKRLVGTAAGAAAESAPGQLLYWQGIAVRQDQGGGRPQIFETLINGVTGELHMDGEGGQDRLDKDTVLLVGGRQRLGGSRRLESHQGRMVCHSGVHAVHP